MLYSCNNALSSLTYQREYNGAHDVETLLNEIEVRFSCTLTKTETMLFRLSLEKFEPYFLNTYLTSTTAIHHSSRVCRKAGKLAKLKYGQANGLTCHSFRHNFHYRSHGKPATMLAPRKTQYTRVSRVFRWALD